ncbi:Protein URA2 [Diplonema papillatum]|nr:Protein URA2 [Diplonema papillatum]
MASFVANDQIDRELNAKLATLQLSDGTLITGKSFGAETSVAGEVVFNTGMVGYPESLSDPSYKGQILVLTYPLVGNYGVPDRTKRDEHGLPLSFESEKVQVTGVIVSNYSYTHSHYASTSSLGDWLKEHNVPALYNVDTRALVKKIRDQGSMLGKIMFNDDKLDWSDPNKRNLCAEVSRKEPQVYGSGKYKIVAVDMGIKFNIIRYFVNHTDTTLKVVPWDYDFSQEDCDGIFLSNGPGDPETMGVTVDNLKKCLAREPPVPIFGICMGHQLLARAAGAKTFKMKFGNRGMNQPVIDMRTTRCYITPQNHGYAVDDKSLPEDWCPLFFNANDYTNEGIGHISKPFFSVQFHPEAMGGPTDTDFLFSMFLGRIKEKGARTTIVPIRRKPDVKKILLLGSGGLSIGQAGEFDYSGSQAIKALKEHNLEVILVNPNIATCQTSRGMADEVYFEPVCPEIVEKIIIKERPDSIMLQFGGQTALNCGVKLRDSGVLEKYNVQVLGTPVDAIIATEDREIFAEKLAEIGEKVAMSQVATSVESALAVANRIGYPVLVRSAFALGGLGSGFAENDVEMKELCQKAFSSTDQVIVDRSLKGWKEIEYEVVRDADDNCITVCNMENFDPLGVHTGDSVVVAPSQTLTNDEYYTLRKAAIKIARHIGIIGECNVQYAVDPFSKDYCVIEMNARLSRSSALASKATGYPLAYVAAKLALGTKLTDIRNAVTQSTCACFEPSLDYCVIKFPRWDMRKFSRVSSAIGSAMKSVGEVMSIGRKFEEAFQKGLRMVDGGIDGFGDLASAEENKCPDEELDELLSNPSDRRVFAIAVALTRGYGVERVYQLTKIDRWFLSKLQNLVDIEQKLTSNKKQIRTDILVLAKKAGFSDRGIARVTNTTEERVRQLRQLHHIVPYVKQIDTLAAEFPAKTNYLYTTFNGDEHDLKFPGGGVMVLGCGAYRIGSSCEFDWCAVSCVRTLNKLGVKSIVVNYNPETVSTDFDESDRLYFEELSLESVLSIYEREGARGVVVSVGGQIPNNLVIPLFKSGVTILGTSPSSIDSCEDRNKFSKLCDTLGIDQPEWLEARSIDEAKEFARRAEYPVLVRPSYVLSGAAMNVADNEADLIKYLAEATNVNKEHPVVLSKFITHAKEIEMDAVAKDGRIINYAVSEHIENAGVHSGDATLCLPAQKLYVETVRRIKRIMTALCARLNITGPVNAQFLSKANDIKIIECNLRASRSFPFVSKTFDVNFIELATKAMVGAPVTPFNIHLYDTEWVCVKSPMFSFTRLQGADPITRVEMASTGEVACFGIDQHEALVKSLLSTGFKLPIRTRAILVSIGPMKAKVQYVSYMKSLAKMGYHLYCTGQTYQFYKDEGVECELVNKPGEDSEQADAVEYIRTGKLDLVINVPASLSSSAVTAGYQMRRSSVDFGVSLITNVQLAVALVQALERVDVNNLQVRSWNEYVTPGYRKQILLQQPGTTPQHRPMESSPASLPATITW